MGNPRQDNSTHSSVSTSSSSTNLSMMNGINNLSCNASYGSVMADQIHPTLNLGPKFRILSRTWYVRRLGISLKSSN